MTLAKKLKIKLIAFTVVLAGASATVIWGLVGLQHLADTGHEEFDELRHVQQAHKHLDQATIAIGRSEHNSALEHLKQAESDLQDFEHFQESRESAQDEAHTSMETRVVEEVVGLIDKAQSRLQLMRIKDQQSAVDLSAVVEDIGLAMEAVVSMTAEMEQVVSEVQNQTIARLRRTTWGLGALFAVLLVGATVANILQYRRLTGELNYLQDGARRLASGNMSVRLCAKADGEFEQLQRDFNYMAAELESLYNDLEERVAAKSKELAVSERRASVGYLAAGVAHEVNNPLGIISGYAESLLRQIRSQSTRSSDLSAIVSGLGIIRDEAFRCKHITQGLLDLSHLGEEHRVPVSIRQVMDDVVQLAHASPAGRDREITVQTDGHNDPLHVLGSSPELKQVALNLTINALQSVSQGTGCVVLDATRCNGWIELCVRDNGNGMDQNTIDQVFEPFYTQGKGRQGVGLGLSISQAIAEQHGGAIIAASDGPGCGSVFTFRRARRHGRQRMKPLGADEYRILVVEDQQRYRELLVREIHEMGFPAHGAESGEAAWECLQNAEFRTVLLDLNLPGMSGMELFAKIRDADHQVSVVILTAYGEMDSAVQALRWNADDYLSKPCSLGQIECILARLHQEWVERQRTEQEPEQIEEERLPQLIPAPQSPDQADATTLEKLEREHILKALAANGGNKPATAEQLGVSLRTLYNRLEKYKYS